MKKRDEVLSESIDDLYYGDEPDYSDELSVIENGGYDEFRDEEYDDPQMAAAIHQAAQEEGLSDLDYVNQQEFFDDIIDNDPENGPIIVEIEERDGYSEFILDDDGNPNLEDARPIYDSLVSGESKGMYGCDCKDNPYKALDDVIEGYDMMVDDAQIGRHTLRGALNLLAKYKDNPKCPKCKKYFDALVKYAEQINDIATSIGEEGLYIDIPGKFEESKRKIKEYREPIDRRSPREDKLVDIILGYSSWSPNKYHSDEECMLGNAKAAADELKAAGFDSEEVSAFFEREGDAWDKDFANAIIKNFNNSEIKEAYGDKAPVFAKINTIDDAYKFLEPVSGVGEKDIDVEASFDTIQGGWLELIEYFYPESMLNLETNKTLPEIEAMGEKIIFQDGNGDVYLLDPADYESRMDSSDYRKAINEGVENMKKLTEGHSWDDFSDPETDSIEKQYLPGNGEGETMYTQAVTATTKLIYKWFNDGDVFDNNYGLKGWANDLSSYANWLDSYIPEAEPILEKIKTIGNSEEAYTDLLYELLHAVFNSEMIAKYAELPKDGTIYDCDGPYSFYEAPTCPECGQECDEWDYEHYGMCSDCYEEQNSYDDDDEEDGIYEHKVITKKAIQEARKAKKKEHKAYKMKEDEEADWAWDLKTEKKALRKSMPAASDNEITIKAAGNIAKKFHTTRAKILATLKPSNNIKGAKTWNKEGKVLVKESRNLKESEEAGLTDIQKDMIKEMVQMDFECGHPENDQRELTRLLSEDPEFAGDEEAAARYYMELLSYGPAGFYEEFRDELDFDPDFAAMYGDGDDDDYDETSSTLDDNDWDEEDDPLYGYGEDDGLDESKKTSKKSINESGEFGPSQVEYISKEGGRGYAKETINSEDDILCDDEAIKAAARAQGYTNEEAFLKGYNDYVMEWLEVPTGYEGELPPEGYEDDFYDDFEDEDDVEHDMGEMYGLPQGASSEEALKFFEDEEEDKDCKGKDCDCKGKDCKNKKAKLDEISDEDLAKIVVAYKADDPDRKPLKDGQGKTYSVPYDEDKSDKDNVNKLKRLLRQGGVSETSIGSLRFRKITA